MLCLSSTQYNIYITYVNVMLICNYNVYIIHVMSYTYRNNFVQYIHNEIIHNVLSTYCRNALRVSMLQCVRVINICLYIYVTCNVIYTVMIVYIRFKYRRVTLQPFLCKYIYYTRYNKGTRKNKFNM